MTEETIRVRVQFINDIDPFTATAYKYEPMNPLMYNFPLHPPITDQLQEIIRLLKAPHRKGDCCLQVLASGELSSYLDSDLSLSEQPDELQILQLDYSSSSTYHMPFATSLDSNQPHLLSPTAVGKLKFIDDIDDASSCPTKFQHKSSLSPVDNRNRGKTSSKLRSTSLAIVSLIKSPLKKHQNNRAKVGQAEKKEAKEASTSQKSLNVSESEDVQEEKKDEINGRGSVVVRQQPILRVKSIIDKLLYMTGRDQKKALFSLKSIFQNDKDLVHEFVRNGGLDALVKLGKSSDQSHQNHILRAIGQLLLYVDGMNGVIAQSQLVVGWLYELLDSQYKLIVKTTLKLLLVFVEYTESNSLLFLATVSHVDRAKKKPDWFTFMRILNDRQTGDEEMLTIGLTLINKTLSGIPDQDTFFDVVDSLEGLRINESIKEMLKLNNTQLAQQCARYEHELQNEDAILNGDQPLNGDARMLAKMRFAGGGKATEVQPIMIRRKQQELVDAPKKSNESAKNVISKFETEDRNQKTNGFGPRKELQTSVGGNKLDGNVTQRRLQMDASIDEMTATMERELRLDGAAATTATSPGQSRPSAQKIDTSLGKNLQQASPKGTNDEKENIIEDDASLNKAAEPKAVKAPPPVMPTNLFSPTEAKQMVFPEAPKTQQSAASQLTQNGVHKPEPVVAKKEEEEEEQNGAAPVGFAALLQKRAKKMEGSSTLRKGIAVEAKVSEAEQKWKEAAEKLKDNSPMIINDLDFSDCLEFEQDPLVLAKMAQMAQDKGLLPGGSVSPVPPPPPFGGGFPPPPPMGGGPPPPPPNSLGVANSRGGREPSPGPSSSKGTLKLHWKPAQTEVPPVPALKRKGTLWTKLQAPQIDVTKLSKLFEQKPKEAAAKKTTGEAKPQVLQVLSVKRSQAINIGLTKFPPISVIPPAIKKFDQTVLNKEGIEKILSTMMPSVEEVERIREAQFANPELPLGQAEQLLLSLSEIDCLLERLRLWLFMLDYNSMEEDVAESLKEWNDAMKEIEGSQTFRQAIGMLLSIGNAINGTDIKAFQLDFLARASETKDPVHKYTLTHHLAEYMLETVPDGTDLYSELGAVSRVSRMDFESTSDNLKKMETDCKACFNYAEKISQKENSASMKAKFYSYLGEVAERIHKLKLVHRTTTNRWNAFLLYLGYAATEIKDQKPTAIFKTIIEFALEYRTNRDKILQTRKRLAEKRERNKTRGMMIGIVQNANPQQQHSAAQRRHRGSNAAPINDKERHQEMSMMLTGTNDALIRRRPVQEKTSSALSASQNEALRNSEADFGNDELLDGVVRTVTAQGDAREGTPRRRRMLNNKNLRRTRTIRQDQLADLNSLAANGNLSVK